MPIGWPQLQQPDFPCLSPPPRAQAAAAAAEAAAAAAEAAEAARLARLKEEYVAAVPDEVRDQVAAAVQREVDRLRKTMVRGGAGGWACVRCTSVWRCRTRFEARLWRRCSEVDRLHKIMVRAGAGRWVGN